MNLLTSPKVFYHSPIISFNPDATDKKYEPIMTVHEDKIFYLSRDNLYSLDYESKDWKKEAPPPFNVEYGHSMTSTPHGLVVFGGYSGGKTLSNIWIYNFDKWRAFTHNITGRAFHSSLWIPSLSSLLISGGYTLNAEKNSDSEADTNSNKMSGKNVRSSEKFSDKSLGENQKPDKKSNKSHENYFNDFILLDLKGGNVRKVPLQKSLPFAYHSIITVTAKGGHTVCLYGGKCNNKQHNEKIFLINLIDGSVHEIDVVPFFGSRYLHKSFNFYGNLLISGGYSDSKRCNDTLLFIFLHRVWLTFNLPKIEAINNLGYILMLEKGIKLISIKGDVSAIVYFNENKVPFTDTKDPKYMALLNSLLDRNLSDQNLDPSKSQFESKRQVLLDERRKLYRSLSLKINQPDLSNLIIERDLLNKLISFFQSKNNKSNAMLTNNSPQIKLPNNSLLSNNLFTNKVDLQVPDIIDYQQAKNAALAQLASMKNFTKHAKNRLERQSKEVEAIFQETQKLMRDTSLFSGSAIEYNDSLMKEASVKDASVVIDEIKKANIEFARASEQLQKFKKYKTDSSINALNAYEQIDALLVEQFKKKHELFDLKNRFLLNMEKILILQSKIDQITTEKMNLNKNPDSPNSQQIAELNKYKECEIDLSSSYDQLNKTRKSDRNYQIQIRDLISQLKIKINKLNDVMSFPSKEQIKSQVTLLLESLSAISKIHNDYAASMAIKDESALLPGYDNPSLRMARLTMSMKHGARPSNPEETFIIKDGLWQNLYCVTQGLIADIELLNKSQND
ncbi:hypothetical protein TRFO_09064 [Tritrichomonas foetus]|uniref:Kelch motif family protein n=1 Tax=Tritrichomonas foetus TaxID=1144522 RepID=A0A1J4JG64_9EUKA|nr:hypothetical protein TRFO_09064 [Tritrichomonas foetus]|eukprot:OHS98190.1 hypothetical protein TRFO_09064 [Tritrichomonas foetus]